MNLTPGPCAHPPGRIHLAQSWPHGPIVSRCRDCGTVLRA